MTNAETKMMLDAHFTATRGMIMAMDDGINKRFDAVDKSNELRNHRLEKAEDKLNCLEKEQIKIEDYPKNCPANKIAVKMQKRWFWIAAGALFVVSYFILEAIYHGTPLGEFISKYI